MKMQKDKSLSWMVWLVLLPILLIIVLTLYKSQADSNKQLKSTNLQVSTQAQNAIDLYCENVELLAKRIENSSLMNFFVKDYKQGKDFPQFSQNIQNNFQYIVSGNTDKSFKIFLNNESFPDAFGTFYQSSELQKFPQIKKFLQDETQDSKFIFLPFHFSYPNFHPLSPMSDTVLYIKRLTPLNLNQNVGYITISFPLSTMLQTVGIQGDFKLDNSYLTINMSSRPVKKEVFTQMKKNNVHEYIEQNMLYTTKNLTYLPFEIATVTSYMAGTSQYVIITMLLLLTVPLTNVLVAVYCRRLVNQTNTLVRQARRAIVGDMKFRLSPSNDKDINDVSTSINTLLERVSTLMEERVEQENAVRDAQIMALQHQINPHFIYNTMEMLAGRLEIKEMYEESDLLTNFAHIFRYNINVNNDQTLLKDEINNVENYLSMQSYLKMQTALQVDIDQEVLQTPMPRFILQPLVENSLEHGGLSTSETLKIFISAKKTREGVWISIQDNGKGIDETQLLKIRENLKAPSLLKKRESIGIMNIQSRLQLLYHSSLQIESVGNQGATISFMLPNAQ